MPTKHAMSYYDRRFLGPGSKSAARKNDHRSPEEVRADVLSDDDLLQAELAAREPVNVAENERHAREANDMLDRLRKRLAGGR